MSIRTKNVEAYMKSYAKKLVALLKKKILEPRQDREEKSSIYSTGKSYESLGVIDRTGGIIEIVGEDYLLDVDKGGVKRVSEEKLADWILAKPVNYRDISGRQGSPITDRAAARSLAKVMKRSISQFGTRPTPFIQEAMQEQLKDLKVVAPVVEDVKESVEDILKEAGFDLKGKTIKFV